MESKNYEDKIGDFIMEIGYSEFVDFEELGPPNPPAVQKETILVAQKMEFAESFVTTFKEIGEFYLHWLQKNSTDRDVAGKVEILPLEQIVKDTEGPVYSMKHIDDDNPIRDFHIVDNFVDEACVGIFAGKNATNSLYYLYYGEDPIYLGLDFGGYIEMVIAAKCYRYWQKAILEIRQKKENAASIEFKKHMPRLFPGWTWEEFVAKYESLKIEENAF